LFTFDGNSNGNFGGFRWRRRERIAKSRSRGWGDLKTPSALSEAAEGSAMRLRG